MNKTRTRKSRTRKSKVVCKSRTRKSRTRKSRTRKSRTRKSRTRKSKVLGKSRTRKSRTRKSKIVGKSRTRKRKNDSGGNPDALLLSVINVMQNQFGAHNKSKHGSNFYTVDIPRDRKLAVIKNPIRGTDKCIIIVDEIVMEGNEVVSLGGEMKQIELDESKDETSRINEFVNEVKIFFNI